MLALKIFVGCMWFASTGLRVASAQNLATNFTAPSLKLRTHDQHFFPVKGDNILLQANGRIPLGADSVRLSSDRHSATIMASLEVPQLGAITVFEHGRRRYVVDEHGEPVRRLPMHLTFRVTASSLVELTEEPYQVDVKDPVLTFLKGLKFSARIFHSGELISKTVGPSEVQVIGIPFDIAAAERVYRANFDVDALSVDDHIVLEVSSAEGTLVSKFFLRLK